MTAHTQADRLDAFLEQFDLEEQERILRHALDHVVPKLIGRAALAKQQASHAAQVVEVPEGAHEALQRLIENGLSEGPASREDALLVARFRRPLLDSATQVREQAALLAEAVQFGRRLTVKPDYSDMSKEALERHAERMAQLLADSRPIEFHRRHAFGSKSMPSCLCCGKLPEEIAIRHMELPDILICKVCHDAALAQGTTPAADIGDWRIDHSAGRPILVYKDCSVLEAEQAYYVLSLLKAAAGVGEQAQAEPMSDEQIDLIAADGMRNAAGGIYATSVYDFARAIERSVLAEAGIKEKT